MNWSSHEFIWLDWAVLAIGLCGVVAAVWYAIWKDKYPSRVKTQALTSLVRVSLGM